MRSANTVPHQNTIFRQVTGNLPWRRLDALIAEHRADRGVRSLSTRDMLLTLLFAQLSGTRSLRDIQAVTDSHQARRYHAGLCQVKRSTLSDALASRPVGVFTGVLSTLMARIGRKHRQELAACVRLIDSTTIRLNRLSAAWSRFSADLCGVKAHVVYDPDADHPLYLGITPARTNDITAAKAMPVEAGATYVFDLGYYDYGWWAKLDAAGCRIVTRLKANTPLHDVREHAVPPGVAHILSDRTGFLPGRLAYSRHNPMRQAVREVRVTTETGKVLRVLTNDLDATAEEIAALYKRRWAIELFFRWIKQMLKLTHFQGTSENAVRIQITVAMIAFALIKLAHKGHEATGTSLTRFARLVSANVIHRRSLRDIRGSADAPASRYADPAQMALL